MCSSSLRKNETARRLRPSTPCTKYVNTMAAVSGDVWRNAVTAAATVSPCSPVLSSSATHTPPGHSARPPRDWAGLVLPSTEDPGLANPIRAEELAAGTLVRNVHRTVGGTVCGGAQDAGFVAERALPPCHVKSHVVQLERHAGLGFEACGNLVW
jgi:hypothetical protein